MTELTLTLPAGWNNKAALDLRLAQWKGQVTGEGSDFLVLSFATEAFAAGFAKNLRFYRGLEGCWA